MVSYKLLYLLDIQDYLTDFDFECLKDLTKESTVMVPIFFDTTASQHGAGFVR
jgi:hypothetical protein